MNRNKKIGGNYIPTSNFPECLKDLKFETFQEKTARRARIDQWNKILEDAKNNPTLMSEVERIEVLYLLSKKHTE